MAATPQTGHATAAVQRFTLHENSEVPGWYTLRCSCSGVLAKVAVTWNITAGWDLHCVNCGLLAHLAADPAAAGISTSTA